MNEAALKQRLKTIAAQKATTLHKIWKQLLLERFLARLSQSPHQDKFIFKGGLLLAQYIAIYRETVDIDFLMTKIKNEMQKIEKVIKEVIAIDSFKRRRTPFTLFIQFDSAGMYSLQTLWNNHLRGLGAFNANKGLEKSEFKRI